MVKHQLLNGDSADDGGKDQIIEIGNEEEANQREKPHVPTDPIWVPSLEQKPLINPQNQKKSWSSNGSFSISRGPNRSRRSGRANQIPPLQGGREANQEEQTQVSIDPTWVPSLEKKLLINPKNQKESWSINGSCSIHRIPNCFRQGGKNTYEPQIVSIGPFHRDNKSLQAMNQNKRKYLCDVISWTQINGGDSQSKVLEKYLIAVKSVEEKARRCYSVTINLDSKAFVEMMVVDGCFIIGLLCKLAELIDIDDDDPIFEMGWLMSRLQNDLLMLENQIPFVVLQCLFDLMPKNQTTGGNHPSLAHLALKFFEGLVPKLKNATKEAPKINGEHLLHLFHSSLLPTAKEDKQITQRNEMEANHFKEAGKEDRDNEREANDHNNQIQSAKAVMEAGIKFKKVKMIIQAVIKFKKLKELMQARIKFKKVKPLKEAHHFKLIQSVKELKEAGIKFEKAEENAADSSFFDVKFKNGTMEIPAVVIDGSTKSLLLNLIAFEQCYTKCTNHFTEYTAFMNCLIDSAIDVRTLCKSGIIVNWLGSEDEVAHLFKMLGRLLTISAEDIYLSDMIKEVNQYSRPIWDKFKGSLERFYFISKWSYIPFAAAVILLGLTFIQTWFSTYAYYHPRS